MKTNSNRTSSTQFGLIFFFENQETPMLVFWVFNGPILNQVLTISYQLRVFLSFINKSFVLGFLNQTNPTSKFKYQQ